MKTQLIIGMMWIYASSVCFGVDLSGISDSNGVISIAIDPAITGDEYVAASVATNLAASDIVRLAAIQTLAKNPTSHLDILRVASRDTDLGIRLAAADALASCDPIDASNTAKAIIRSLETNPPAFESESSFGLRAAALLAKMNDPSGFEFVASRLSRAEFAAEKVSALAYLPEFRRFPEIPAGKVIVHFIEETLPALEQEGTQTRQEADILLPRAFLALYHLRAVETLPQLKEWEKVLSGSPLINLQYYMRGLEAYTNKENILAPAR